MAKRRRRNPSKKVNRAIRTLGKKRKRGRPRKAASRKIAGARKVVGQVTSAQLVKRRGGRKLSKKLASAHRQCSRLVVDGRAVTVPTYLRWRKKAGRARKGVAAWLRAHGHKVLVLGGRSRKFRKRKAARGVAQKRMHKLALRRRRARRRNRR